MCEGNRIFDVTSSFKIVGLHDLHVDLRQLLVNANKARTNAQAPYSEYCVGAAVLAESGSFYSGCNVERASYTQTTHAEQNAIDSMVAAEGSVKIEALAVIGAPKTKKVDLLIGSEEDEPILTAPCCGHCLQIIWENCHNDPSVMILSLLPSGHIMLTTIADLLPLRFGPGDLGIDYSKKQ